LLDKISKLEGGRRYKIKFDFILELAPSLLRKYRAQYNMGASSYCSGTNQNREAGRKKVIFFLPLALDI
jgi:hypothetical protein